MKLESLEELQDHFVLTLLVPLVSGGSVFSVLFYKSRVYFLKKI